MGDVIWNHIQLACVFLSADKTAISQGQTVFIPQGLVVLGIFTIIGGIYSVWKNFRCIYRSYDCILV